MHVLEILYLNIPIQCLSLGAKFSVCLNLHLLPIILLDVTETQREEYHSNYGCNSTPTYSSLFNDLAPSTYRTFSFHICFPA